MAAPRVGTLRLLILLGICNPLQKLPTSASRNDFKIFLLFSDVSPTPPKKEKISDQVLPQRGSCKLSPPLLPPSPRRASRAGLCQRLNKRLRPLDARPVTSPIHKTWTGCQAGAARAVAMETANPAPRAARGPASHLRTSGGRPGNALRTGAVAGQGSPYLPAPHLDSPHRARSLGRLGGFFAASPLLPLPISSSLCCLSSDSNSAAAAAAAAAAG